MDSKELKERFVNERTGIEYRLVGDYYLPNIILLKPRRKGIIGKYGRLRLKYLEEHHKPEVMIMRVNNELTSYLLYIEDECKARIEQLVKQIEKKYHRRIESN